MVTAKLYVEGAGPRRAQQSQCRRAFAKFFEAAGVKNRPGVEPCGGRKEAFDNFCRAMKSADANQLPLLLVDAEDAIAAGHTTWQHLKARPSDDWNRPAGAGDDRAFLMVQVMETWFLADLTALRQYFGPHFSNTPFRVGLHWRQCPNRLSMKSWRRRPRTASNRMPRAIFRLRFSPA